MSLATVKTRLASLVLPKERQARRHEREATAAGVLAADEVGKVLHIRESRGGSLTLNGWGIPLIPWKDFVKDPIFQRVLVEEITAARARAGKPKLRPDGWVFIGNADLRHSPKGPVEPIEDLFLPAP